MPRLWQSPEDNGPTMSRKTAKRNQEVLVTFREWLFTWIAQPAQRLGR